MQFIFLSLGTGEKLDQIEPFHPGRMASRILGMGDMLTLIEKAEQSFDQKKALEAAERLKSNRFTLSDYLDQMAQLKNMGDLESIMGMIPGMDAKALKGAKIDEKVLNDRVILYPGADELGMVLVSRAINALENNTPRVYLKYASTLAPQLIPNYEDRSLNETVKYHVMAAGCIAVPSLADADVVMGITAPANEMEEAANQPANNINYDVERNMAEFLYFVNDCLKRGIPTAILDNAYTNGGELQLLRVLNKQGVLMKLAGYAGWNTSANSMGTVLAMIVNNMYQNNTEAKQNFLVERFIEDFGYGAVVRSYVTEHILPQWGMTYFWCEEQRGKAANAVLEELRKFVETEMTSVADKVTVEDIFLPWSRMFEIGLKATYKAD